MSYVHNVRTILSSFNSQLQRYVYTLSLLKEYCVYFMYILYTYVYTYSDISSSNVHNFVEECVITSKLDHSNVLSLIGVSINPDDATLLMIMPFMDNGDLKSFLKSKRGDVIEFCHFPEVWLYGNDCYHSNKNHLPHTTINI